MSKYKIADLEQLSGIKAHTIRIWEQRYRLISPKRTETNIRYYDDDEVRKLLNVVTLQTAGFRISEIAAMKDGEISREVARLTDGQLTESIELSFVNDLTAAALRLEENAFERAMASAVTRLGMPEAMLRVFFPFLRKTGLLWSVKQLLPVQEHFASCIIRRKLLAAIDGLALPENHTDPVMLFLPENEWHEIGLIFADYVFRSKGRKTIYLGPNVPLENLTEAIRQMRPRQLMTVLTIREKNDEHQRLLTTCVRLRVPLTIGASVEITEELKSGKIIKFLNTPEELLKMR